MIRIWFEGMVVGMYSKDTYLERLDKSKLLLTNGFMVGEKSSLEEANKMYEDLVSTELVLFHAIGQKIRTEKFI